MIRNTSNDNKTIRFRFSFVHCFFHYYRSFVVLYLIYADINRLVCKFSRLHQLQNFVLHSFSSIPIRIIVQRLLLLLQLTVLSGTSNTFYTSFNLVLCFCSSGSIRWSEKIIFFYKAPIVRFYYNLVCIINSLD